MELANRERSVGGKAWGIELRVIDQHLTDIGLGSLGRRSLGTNSAL